MTTGATTSCTPQHAAGQGTENGERRCGGGPVSEATVHQLETGEDPDAFVSDLWARYVVDRDVTLRDRLILHYAPLVKYVAGRVGSGLPAHVEQADLVSYGTFGLIDAITRYQPSREVKFESYAMARIRGAIIDELRTTDWIPS